MKFTISAAELNAKLAALAKVIGSKTAQSIYSTFLLELKDGVLRITASDMDCSWCGTLPVMDMDGAERHNGSICVTASFLLDSLKNLGDQPVTFKVDEENLSVVICYNNGQFNMVGFPAKDYVLPSVMKEYVQTTIEASVLMIVSPSRSMLSAVMTFALHLAVSILSGKARNCNVPLPMVQC